MSDEHPDIEFPLTEEPSNPEEHVFDDDPEMAQHNDEEPPGSSQANLEVENGAGEKVVDSNLTKEIPTPNPEPNSEPSPEPKQTLNSAKEFSINNSQRPKDAPSPSTTPPEEHITEETAAPPDKDLFAKILASPATVPGLVTEWITHVQVNGPSSVADVLSFVVRMARPDDCPPLDLITPSMVVANDPRATIHELSCILKADVGGKVSVVAKDAASRRVRRAFEDFWNRLSGESVRAVLFDTDCYETLISWLDVMAVAPSRALRTAACLAAYRLVDGLVDFGAKLRKQLASMQRQLATEKRKCGVAPDQVRKKGRGKASSRAKGVKTLSTKGKELAKKVDELTAENGELCELSDKVFDAIFILKYRDVSPEIRTVSVMALGSWVMLYPEHFLDDKHTKYIGWLLSDKDPVVRRSTLEILRRMLAKKDFFQGLQLFLQSFIFRLVEMTRDKDDSVAIASIRLLTGLTQYELLEDKSCQTICDIAIGEPQVEVRRAAGEFLVSLIDVGDGKDNLEPAHGKRRTGNTRQSSRRKSKTTPDSNSKLLAKIPTVTRSCRLIKELLFIIRSDGILRNPELAIDAVFNSMPALRCWDAFATLLKDDHGGNSDSEKAANNDTSSVNTQDESLNDSDRVILCEMLLASVKLTSANLDAARRGIVGKCELDCTDDPRLIFSKCFSPILCQVLVLFQANHRALCALLELPTHFQMECFEQEGEEKHLQGIIVKVLDIMSRHTKSPDLVNVCTKTLRVLQSEKNPLQKVVLKSLQREIASAAKELSIIVRAELSKAEPLAVAAVVLRLRALSELIEPTARVHEPVLKLLEFQIEQGSVSGLGDDVTVDAARAGCALILWSLHKFRSLLLASEENGTAGKSLALDEIRETHGQGAVVIDLLRQVCSSSSSCIYARISCLQALLTTLTLCRAVEKEAGSIARPLCDSDNADGKPALSTYDFLDYRPQTDNIVTAVRLCVLSVIEHDRGIRDHSVTPGTKQRRKKYVPIPEAALRDCFASLVQASCQSVLSGKISHLPFLGLLLKRKKPTSRDSTTVEWTPFQICRKYCQNPHMKDDARLRGGVRSLMEIIEVQSSQSRYHLVKELGDLIVNIHTAGEPIQKAPKQLIERLISTLFKANYEGFEVSKAIEILAVTGCSLVTRLSVSDAKNLSESLEEVVEFARVEQVESSMLTAFSNCLDAVACGEIPNIPKMPKKITQLMGHPVPKARKKRKRSAKDPGEYHQTSVVTIGNVRRSGRERKKIDYARLIGLNENGSEEEDDALLDNASESENLVTESVHDSARPATVAEVARNMMEFTNSPRLRRTSPTMPSSALLAQTNGHGEPDEIDKSKTLDPDFAPSDKENIDNRDEHDNNVQGPESGGPRIVRKRQRRW